ncbi:MAG: contractile injection system protein, VgrG/Pvc8 family [Spirochaetota bacterium]
MTEVPEHGFDSTPDSSWPPSGTTSLGEVVRFHFESPGLDMQASVRAVTIEEHLNQPFEAVIELRTEHHAGSVRDLLGQDCSLSIERSDSLRWIKGVVRHAMPFVSHDVTTLTLRLVPALWMRV